MKVLSRFPVWVIIGDHKGCAQVPCVWVIIGDHEGLAQVPCVWVIIGVNERSCMF